MDGGKNKSSKQYDKSVFIFRRDLRLEDNVGLIEALKKSDSVYPVFIFTPEQIVANPYKSNNCVQFMVESLKDLNEQLARKNARLMIFFGKQHEIVKQLIEDKKMGISAVFVNQDYTPYAIDRDEKIKKVCHRCDVDFLSSEDVLLHPFGTIKTGSGETYSKFTPFFSAGVKNKVSDIKRNPYTNYVKKNIIVRGEFGGNIDDFY